MEARTAVIVALLSFPTVAAAEEPRRLLINDPAGRDRDRRWNTPLFDVPHHRSRPRRVEGRCLRAIRKLRQSSQCVPHVRGVVRALSVRARHDRSKRQAPVRNHRVACARAAARARIVRQRCDDAGAVQSVLRKARHAVECRVRNREGVQGRRSSRVGVSEIPRASVTTVFPIASRPRRPPDAAVAGPASTRPAGRA
jgi:hypothetical protein